MRNLFNRVTTQNNHLVNSATGASFNICPPAGSSLSSPKQVLSQSQKTPEMSVIGLNRFNISAPPVVIEQVKYFYEQVLGFKIGPRADLDHLGYWLYAGNAPILHLSIRPELTDEAIQCSGLFNHISLNCVGLQATLERLNALKMPYRLLRLSDIEQTQVFITDPAGIGVELTFFNESIEI